MLYCTIPMGHCNHRGCVTPTAEKVSISRWMLVLLIDKFVYNFVIHDNCIVSDTHMIVSKPSDIMSICPINSSLEQHVFIEECFYWLCIKEIHRWSIDSAHKEQFMRIMFPCHDITMKASYQQQANKKGHRFMVVNTKITSLWLHERPQKVTFWR